jgi:hypothetical protein
MYSEIRMKIKISNKLFFYTLGIIKLLFILILILFLILTTYLIVSHKPDKEVYLHLRFIPLLFAGIGLIITRIISPSYFECIILPNELKIRFFNPDRRNTLQFILVMFSLENLKEHILDRKSYNGYILKIGKFGIKKYIILHMIDEGKMYDSKPINISFLGARKYIELILALDRLKEKISMN